MEKFRQSQILVVIRSLQSGLIMSNLRRSLQELGENVGAGPPRHSKTVLEYFSTVPQFPTLPRLNGLGLNRENEIRLKSL